MRQELAAAQAERDSEAAVAADASAAAETRLAAVTAARDVAVAEAHGAAATVAELTERLQTMQAQLQAQTPPVAPSTPASVTAQPQSSPTEEHERAMRAQATAAATKCRQLEATVRGFTQGLRWLGGEGTGHLEALECRVAALRRALRSSEASSPTSSASEVADGSVGQCRPASAGDGASHSSSRRHSSPRYLRELYETYVVDRVQRGGACTRAHVRVCGLRGRCLHRYHYVVQHLRSAADLPRVAHELGHATEAEAAARVAAALPLTLATATAALQRQRGAGAGSPGSRVAELTKRSFGRRSSDGAVAASRRASVDATALASTSRPHASSQHHPAARVLASFNSMQRAVHRSRTSALQLTLQRDDLRRRLQDTSVRLAGTQRLLDHSRQALADDSRSMELRPGADAQPGGVLVRHAPGHGVCGPTARGLLVAIAVALLALFFSSVVLRAPVVTEDWGPKRLT